MIINIQYFKSGLKPISIFFYQTYFIFKTGLMEVSLKKLSHMAKANNSDFKVKVKINFYYIMKYFLFSDDVMSKPPNLSMMLKR